MSATKHTQQVQGPDPRVLAEVANAVDIRTVRVQRVHGEIGIAPEDLPPQFGVAFRFAPVWRSVPKRPGFDVRVEVKLIGAEKVEDNTWPDTPPVFALEAAVVVEYLWNKPPPDDAAERLAVFSGVNGVVNAWPYLRAEIHSLSSKMGLPAILLPVFRPGRPAMGGMRFDLVGAGDPAVRSSGLEQPK